MLNASESSVSDCAVPAGALSTRRVCIEGMVPLESYNELARCFIDPAIGMNLKRLRLHVELVFEAEYCNPIVLSDSSIDAMQETARQFGLDLVVRK